jgi:hypothetical protein
VHGFVDESQRGRTYYVGAVLVPTSALASCRRALRQLLCRGERRIHFNNEASARRRELLSAMVRLEARAWIYHPRPLLKRLVSGACGSSMATPWSDWRRRVLPMIERVTRVQ